MVLFVHTDGVGNVERLAIMVVKGCIKVINRSQAVASELQRVCAKTQAIFTNIKSVLAVVRRVRVGVRDDHFRQRDTVE